MTLSKKKASKKTSKKQASPSFCSDVDIMRTYGLTDAQMIAVALLEVAEAIWNQSRNR